MIKIIFSLVILSMSLFSAELKTQKSMLYTFNESELNEAVNEKLPYEIDYMYVFNIKLLSSHVKFTTNDRLKSEIDSNVSMYLGDSKTSFEAKVTLSSGVEYFASRESLYLKKPKIESIIVKDIDKKYTNMASSAISRALLSYYEDHPVYTLNAQDKKEIGYTINDVAIKNREFVVSLQP